MTRPLVAVSCGDPAGIGPEIAAAAWESVRDTLDMVWIGDPRCLPGGTAYRSISDPADAPNVMQDALPVLELPLSEPVTPGQMSLANAGFVTTAIERAVELVKTGAADAICTAPIHKKVLQDGAGFAFPGHTEFLAHLAGGSDVVMMLASEQLRVVPATIHIALSEVPRVLTPELLCKVIDVTADGLTRQFGIKAPRIAVAGLNPHAGEGGAMGREELDWITDVVEEFAKSGLHIRGPLSADTMFHPAAREGYDAAICM